MTPAQELDLVIEEIGAVIRTHKADYDKRSMDWRPFGGVAPETLEGAKLRRCRRGSARWIVGKWRMQIQERYLWFEQYTGRRRNKNAPGCGEPGSAPDGDEPVWEYETFGDAIQAEARGALMRCLGCESIEADMEPFCAEVVNTLLDEASIAV